MCGEWARNFEAFLRDLGPRPDEASLERIDNDGNYEPGNVCWATPKQQSRNTRRNVAVLWKGRRLILKDLAASLGLMKRYRMIGALLQSGVKLDEALRRAKQRPVRFRTRVWRGPAKSRSA